AEWNLAYRNHRASVETLQASFMTLHDKPVMFWPPRLGDVLQNWASKRQESSEDSDFLRQVQKEARGFHVFLEEPLDESPLLLQQDDAGGRREREVTSTTTSSASLSLDAVGLPA
ncbi:unnamed protein product, partial [Amoebophrya sp. A25]